MWRPIPTLSDVSPRYGEIVTRIATLQRELSALDVERNEVVNRIAPLQQQRDLDKIKALAANIDLPQASPIADRLTEIEDRRHMLREAITLLVNERTEEHRSASKLICDSVAGEREALTKEMFEGLAAAAAARVGLGLLALEIERTGATAGGFDQPLHDLFGPALARNSDMAIELRKAIRAGILPASALPEELR